jgi:glycosyltransferase involved in cell wall biosynthesis
VRRLRVHVVYEYGVNGRPHASSFVRLLRPLRHPTVRDRLELTAGPDFREGGPDVVAVDRLWRPDVSRTLAEQLVERVRDAGARLVYFLDDNLLDLGQERADWPSTEHLAVIELFLGEADTIVVTTEALRQRVSSLGGRVVVLPNALDERLLVGRAGGSRGRPERWVVGYMGTRSHDADLLLVAPALRALARRHPDAFEVQLVGGVARPQTLEALGGVPVRLVEPRPEEAEYPLFMLWFSSQLAWDVALAPLRSTPFGRCKSDIKFLDYSAIGAAGVYSRGPAYDASVRHRETGWLVDDEPSAWEEALEGLLRDDALRAQIARNATRYLEAERLLARRAHLWLAALEDAR